MPTQQLNVMVSSSVYGSQELLEHIFTLFTSFGYRVWMSHKGTMPVFPNLSAFDSCLKAVEECDLFFGLITPYYGSGRESRNAISITHNEFKKAIELEKPHWVMAHSHVVFARTLINHLGLKSTAQRPRFRPARSKLTLKPNAAFDDLRIIEMYEDAIKQGEPLSERRGNWVQPYSSISEVSLFIENQFSDQTKIRLFLERLNAKTGEES